ncbi:hypothetical protein CEJ86_33805 [Sinorhizobium meliloti]|uniref:Uncharacterized protein n=1 Tax=Rhizobium meliloti TaxID=382 RepID=A0A2J0YSF5_RHIML|nr:hypothetical protein CEJ86_33805 [Sinorhizobium meliloti]
MLFDAIIKLRNQQAMSFYSSTNLWHLYIQLGSIESFFDRYQKFSLLSGPLPNGDSHGANLFWGASLQSQLSY